VRKKGARGEGARRERRKGGEVEIIIY